MNLEERLEDPRQSPIGQDAVDEMLELAERIQSRNGGALDDASIQAVSEATGAPLEYVRLAARLRTEKKRQSFFSGMRAQFGTLDAEIRRYVVSGVAASLTGLLMALEAYVAGLPHLQSYELFSMLALIVIAGGLYNVSVSRDTRAAAVSGAILGGGFVVSNAIFSFIFMAAPALVSAWLIPMTVVGALGGIALFRLVDKYRYGLGLKDPAKERQELLRQLHDLKEKLHSGEQSLTFLSVDIVGSTRMKEASDPLSVEFTFNEYHQFVERVCRRYGGRVHSKAGDGIICAFDHPQQGFGAARNIQGGLMELNAFRNKIGIPIVLRSAVHTGTVVAPQAGDITSVNFAHVIDMTAHLQKICPPGGVVVSDAAALHLPGSRAAIGTETVSAMGMNGTIWMPRHATSALGAGAPPPSPGEPSSAPTDDA
jgi:class 3 adenylate cyclase